MWFFLNGSNVIYLHTSVIFSVSIVMFGPLPSHVGLPVSGHRSCKPLESTDTGKIGSWYSTCQRHVFFGQRGLLRCLERARHDLHRNPCKRAPLRFLHAAILTTIRRFECHRQPFLVAKFGKSQANCDCIVPIRWWRLSFESWKHLCRPNESSGSEAGTHLQINACQSLRTEMPEAFAASRFSQNDKQ